MWLGEALYWLRLHRAVIRHHRRIPKVLAYHACEPRDHELLRGLDLNTPPDVFAAQLRFLAEHYTVVSLEQMATGECPERAVAITFDDGYRSVYDHAFPLLRRHGWPATVFLVAQAVDNTRLVWVNELLYLLRRHPEATGSVLERRHGVPRSWPARRIINHLVQEADPPSVGATLDECRRRVGVKAEDLAAETQLHLNRRQIAEMAAAGITFGNHTVTHPNLLRLDEEGQRTEVSAGREVLRHLPGYIDAFAYPFGAGMESVGALATKLGHRMVLELGGWNAPLDRRSVGRIRVSARSTAAFFAEMEVVAPIKAWLKRRLRAGRPPARPLAALPVEDVQRVPHGAADPATRGNRHQEPRDGPDPVRVPPRSLRRRVRAVLTNGALLLISLLLALLVAEGAVRLVAPQQLIILRPDIWHGVDSLGWFRRPFVDSTINTGEGRVHIVTDRHGFRVSRAGPRQSDVNILLLGDSFMEALQVEYAQSTAGLLERRLSEVLGQPVAVHNSAHAGWDPNQYRIAAEKFLPSASYAMVVVALYVGNDVVGQRVDYFPPRSPIQRHAFHLPRSFRWKEIIDAFLYPVNDFLEVRSHLFVLLKTRARGLLMRLGLTAAYFPLTLRVDHAQYAWWNVTADICRSLSQVAAKRGVPTLFALVPAPQQVDQQAFQEYLRGFRIDPAAVDLEQPNRLLGQALRDRGLHVIDPLMMFRAAAEDDTRLYGAVDNHLNAAGHELFSAVLASVITPYLERVLATGEHPPTSSAGSNDPVRE